MDNHDVTIPLVLCMDVEPDEHIFPPDRPSAWDGFEQLLREVPRLREKLARVTGHPVHFNWALRVDQQVSLGYGSPTYIIDKYGDQLRNLVGIGDAIGVHPHAWRWSAGKDAWVSDHADPQWTDECVAGAVTGFRQAWGDGPSFHRFGAAFMSTRTMNRLRQLGVTCDMTVEPGEPARASGLTVGDWTGTTGDFVHAQSLAYRPAADDYLRPARDGEAGSLWELPLTSGQVVYAKHRARHPVRTLRNAGRKLLPRRATRSGGQGTAGTPQAPDGPSPERRLLAMWLDWRSPGDFWSSAWAAAPADQPHLAFAIRTDTGVDPSLKRSFRAIMDALEQERRASSVAFMTPAEALGVIGRTGGRAQLGSQLVPN